MSGYAYKGTPAAPLVPIEQARRRNAELRLELEQLAAENARLAPLVEAKRREVAAAEEEIAPPPPKPRAKWGTGSKHGTARRYEQGCKCDPCKAAKRAKDQRYRTNLKRRLGTL